MKAIVYTKYGSSDVLELKEVEKPTPKDNEVLVRVLAASVNAADLDWVRGIPLVCLSGPLKPNIKILGSDVAGRVEAVGRNVKQLKPGDEGFADLSMCGFGAFAEYVCVAENALVPKSAGMPFGQAAAVPQAAVVALQGLRGKGEIQPG
jgi:NADPH:quinone reductase-like Zn-dependent oxidoreductase